MGRIIPHSDSRSQDVRCRRAGSTTASLWIGAPDPRWRKGPARGRWTAPCWRTQAWTWAWTLGPGWTWGPCPSFCERFQWPDPSWTLDTGPGKFRKSLSRVRRPTMACRGSRLSSRRRSPSGRSTASASWKPRHSLAAPRGCSRGQIAAIGHVFGVFPCPQPRAHALRGDRPVVGQR
jgi:hypothetical protein